MQHTFKLRLLFDPLLSLFLKKSFFFSYCLSPEVNCSLFLFLFRLYWEISTNICGLFISEPIRLKYVQCSKAREAFKSRVNNKGVSAMGRSS